MGHPLRRLRERVSGAWHAARGAPRLYRAAREAGTTPADAGRLLLASAAVLFVVAPRAAGVRGRQNAVRHFVWQALLAARYGEAVARAVAEAQERGSIAAADSAVDRRNNTVAQAYAAAHPELATGPVRIALARLLDAGLSAWDVGELAR